MRNVEGVERETGFVYALRDPVTHWFYYVGQSLNPRGRFREHLKEKLSPLKLEWVEDLTARGLLPWLMILERVPLEQLYQREGFWITKLRDQGHPLFNKTHGSGKRFTPEQRQRHLLALKRIGELKRGKSRPVEVGRKISAATRGRVKVSSGFEGHKHSLETRVRMREAHLRRYDGRTTERRSQPASELQSSS